MSNSYNTKLKASKENEHPFAVYVRILGKGKTGSRSLNRQEAFSAMQMILAGQTTDVQLGAFLMLLRVKEESHEELAGFVDAVRARIDLTTSIHVDLDWSSYAGKKRQLPWFILSALLLADNGVRVFMHGANGHTQGRLYTELVLQQLNIPVATDLVEVQKQLDTTQFSFMPLNYLCPELQNIIDLRAEFGLRSPVNTLSRLINPLLAEHSLQSVFHPSYGDTHQRAAELLGQTHSAVFKGEGGEIERKPEASCLVKMVRQGQTTDELWDKLIDGRQDKPSSLNTQELVDVWRGTADNQYGKLAIIGTAAIALKLMNKIDSKMEALKLADQLWNQRNKNRLN